MIGRLKAVRSRFWILAMPIGIGFALIILAVLGTMYSQEQREQHSLEEQVTQLQRVASSSFQTREELEAKYEEIRQAIPVALTSEAVILDVLSIAEANGFDTSVESGDIQKITSGKPRKETIQETSYNVLVFDMTICTDYDKVEDFILDMDSTPILPTLVIEALDISRMAEDKATAEMRFAVYALEG